MGYACPVCGDPQADAGHLANHLAFTAMIREDGHEAWLDEHAPGWSDWGEEELAEHLHGHDELETADYPQVFEDTTDETRRDDPASERSGALFDENAGHSHDHGGHTHGQGGTGGEFPDAVTVDPASDDLSAEERAEIVAEARELTRQMYEGDDGDAAAEDTGEEAAGGGTAGEGTPGEDTGADDDEGATDGV